MPEHSVMVFKDYEWNIILYQDAVDTIANLKAQIFRKKGIPIEEQELFPSACNEQAQDNQTLSEFGISEHGLVSFNLKHNQSFLINVHKLGGDGWILKVEPSDTIEKVKTKIHEQSDIRVEQQCLVFEGEVIGKDFWNIVSDYNLQQGSVLQLIVQEEEFTLCIRFADSLRSCWLDVKSSDTIYDVKVKIQAKTNIAPEMQCLRLDALILIDSVTLELYDIDNSTHHLLLDVHTV